MSEKALSSPLFIQERKEPANLKQTNHSHEESLLPAQSFSTRTSTGRPVYEPSSDLSQKRKSSRDLENERIKILLKRQKDQIVAEVRSEIQKHELQAESDKISIQVFTGIIDSQRMENDHTITGCERDQLLLQEEISEQNRDLRETCIRSMRDMEELPKSHVLKVEELSKRKLTEDFDAITILPGPECQDRLQPWRSTQMLRLTTSTPIICWLHHCTFSSEKQVRACCKFITHKEKACFNVHSQFLASTGKPSTGCHKSANLTNSQTTVSHGTHDMRLSSTTHMWCSHVHRAAKLVSEHQISLPCH